MFFAMLERAVIGYCRSSGRAGYDAEIERLYTHLRRRPDGRDANVLFSYMQAATRLYMSMFDVSQAELDAVARRLSQSAGRFADGPTSKTLVNPQNVIAGGDTISHSLSVPAGQTKTETIPVTIGQDRILRFKSCKGVVLTAQTFRYAEEKGHVDIP